MEPTHKMGERLYHWKDSLVYQLMPYGWQLVITDELFLSKLEKI